MTATPVNQSALHAVFVDDDKTQLASFGRTLNRLLSELDPKIDVEQMEIKAGEELDRQFSRIESDLVQRRPHLVFVDNQMNKEDGAGQKLIQILKSRMPDTLFCLLTRQSIRSDNFGLSSPNPDIILSKAYLKAGEPHPYKGYVRSLIRDRLTRSSRYAIDWDGRSEHAMGVLKDRKGKRVHLSEVNSVIEQVLFDGTIERPAVESTFKIFPITGGRSGSVVLGMQLCGTVQHPITGVLKLSTVKKAHEEIVNYGRYVKWVLPYTWRIDIIGTGFSENVGAVCYSFAFEGQNQDAPVSASDLLREGDESIVSRICSSIFDPNRKTWYSKVDATGEEMSSYFSSDRFYRNKSSTSFEDREQALIGCFAEVFADDFSIVGDLISLFGITSERPTKLILTEDWGMVDECISHGDLHCGNILVNRGSGALAFIDFQQTGVHYIFRDFISVESSVRIDWKQSPESLNCRAALQGEIDLALMSRSDDGDLYLRLCKKIRETGFANFPSPEPHFRQRLMLLGAFTQFSWLVTRFTDWSDIAKRRLLLGAFGALVGLQRMRDNESTQVSQP